MNISAVLQRIDERLEALGMSQDRASKLAGHADAIRNMRRGKGMHARTLNAIARVLEVSPAWLMGDEAADSVPLAPGGDLDTLRQRRIRLLRDLESVDYAISFLEQAHSEARPQRKQKGR